MLVWAVFAPVSILSALAVAVADEPHGHGCSADDNPLMQVDVTRALRTHRAGLENLEKHTFEMVDEMQSKMVNMNSAVAQLEHEQAVVVSVNPTPTQITGTFTISLQVDALAFASSLQVQQGLQTGIALASGSKVTSVGLRLEVVGVNVVVRFSMGVAPNFYTVVQSTFSKMTATTMTQFIARGLTDANVGVAVTIGQLNIDGPPVGTTVSGSITMDLLIDAQLFATHADVIQGMKNAIVLAIGSKVQASSVTVKIQVVASTQVVVAFSIDVSSSLVVSVNSAIGKVTVQEMTFFIVNSLFLLDVDVRQQIYVIKIVIDKGVQPPTVPPTTTRPGPLTFAPVTTTQPRVTFPLATTRPQKASTQPSVTLPSGSPQMCDWGGEPHLRTFTRVTVEAYVSGKVWLLKSQALLIESLQCGSFDFGTKNCEGSWPASVRAVAISGQLIGGNVIVVESTEGGVFWNGKKVLGGMGNFQWQQNVAAGQVDMRQEGDRLFITLPSNVKFELARGRSYDKGIYIDGIITSVVPPRASGFCIRDGQWAVSGAEDLFAQVTVSGQQAHGARPKCSDAAYRVALRTCREKFRGTAAENIVIEDCAYDVCALDSTRMADNAVDQWNTVDEAFRNLPGNSNNGGQSSAVVGAGSKWCRNGDWGSPWAQSPCIRCEGQPDCAKYGCPQCQCVDRVSAAPPIPAQCQR